MYKTVLTEYSITATKFDSPLTFALISDLHSRTQDGADMAIRLLRTQKPDFILAVGDIFERLDGKDTEQMAAGLKLLRAAAELAPTFYSFGNHENGGTRSWNKLKWSKIKHIEKYYAPEQLAAIRECGVHILDDAFSVYDGICFGGLSSGLINEGQVPNTLWLDDFCAQNTPKVLLCHHPEYYKRYLQGRDIDLVVSGHAHGGQWRIFGRGVFAPGQGIFPKYTSGVYHGNFVVSRGLKARGRIPRIFNSPEVVFIRVDKINTIGK